MKRYVLQMQAHAWGGPWETLEGRQYDTLEEAKAALAAIPAREGCRIAESYTVVRYKAVKI